MSDRKTLTLSRETFAAALLLTTTLGAGAGVSADRIVVPVLETSARPEALRFAVDGYGLDVSFEAGAGRGAHVLNWDRNGGAPLIDGQPYDNDRAREIGKAAATFAGFVEGEIAKMADELAAHKPSVAPAPSP